MLSDGGIFLLTRLLRGVTMIANSVGIIDEFLLTRLLRGVTYMKRQRITNDQISTHTPLARRDKAIFFR